MKRWLTWVRKSGLTPMRKVGERPFGRPSFQCQSDGLPGLPKMRPQWLSREKAQGGGVEREFRRNCPRASNGEQSMLPRRLDTF